MPAGPEPAPQFPPTEAAPLPLPAESRSWAQRWEAARRGLREAPERGRELARRSNRGLQRRFPGMHERVSAFLSSLPVPQTRRERVLYSAILVGLLVTIAAPFLLRPSERPWLFGRTDDELVILTPHNETIRREFGAAFARWYRDRTGRTVRVDWRTPGGTSEIVKVIHSEYFAAFENHWRKTQRRLWQDAFGKGFADPANDPPAEGVLTLPQEARKVFLESEVGIGVDLFFGGGVYDFERQRRAGTLVAADASGRYGLAALRRAHPDWFREEVIPQEVSGEPFHHPDMVWAGTALSTFGIVYNTDVLERLGVPEPTRWEDLTDPRYFGEVAVADPSKSGSTVKAFEMIIQQQVREALEEAREEIAQTPHKQREERERATIREGWSRGLQLIQRIGANARYFTDAATKVPHDVAQGIAAAGMCIDFYGRTFSEKLRRPDGTSRVKFIAPEGGSSYGVDSIAMFRGSPNPEVAHAFMEFVLSVEGQSLWNYRPGTPGGPETMSLRRLPVRRDMYVPERLRHFADPDILPYEQARKVVYRPEWTATSFDAIRAVVRVMCIDTHEELREAWRELAAQDFPPTATAFFSDLGPLPSESTRQSLSQTMRSGDKLMQVRTMRLLGAQFRKQYERAERMAEP